MAVNQNPTIVRAKRTNGFTVLSNSVINDRRLSWRARGILVYLLSKPDDWKVYVTDIVNNGDVARDAVNTALNELLAVGYMVRTEERDTDGRITGRRTLVRDDPTIPFQETGDEPPLSVESLTSQVNVQDSPYPVNPHTPARRSKAGKPATKRRSVQDSPETEKPYTANPDTVNRQLQRTELDQGRREQRTEGKVPSEPPAAASRTVGSVNELTEERAFDLVAAMCEELGTVAAEMAPTWIGKQGAIAKRMMEQGWTVDQVRRFTRWAHSCSWRTKSISMFTLQGEGDDWKANGEPITAERNDRGAKGNFRVIKTTKAESANDGYDDDKSALFGH